MSKPLIGALTAMMIVFGNTAGADPLVPGPSCEFCLSFTSADSLDGFRQSVTITAPRRGHVLVTAHGSLTCTNTVSELKIVDLSSQLVQGNEAVAISGPGRLSLFAQLPGSAAVTFNLASMRVFPVGPGTTEFHLRLSKSLFHPNVNCHVRDVALTALFGT